MAANAVVQERLGRRFELWDSDGNGRIDKSDFQSEAQKIVKAFGEKADGPRAHAVVDAFMQMWDFLSTKAGVGPNGSLSASDFGQVAQKEIIEPGNSGFATALRPTIRAIIDLCDTDGDGQVSPTEFATWLRAIGVDQSQANAAFQAIDTNGDGNLDTEELLQAIRQYHQGENDIPLLGR